jgi:hypothetical protein
MTPTPEEISHDLHFRSWYANYCLRTGRTNIHLINYEQIWRDQELREAADRLHTRLQESREAERQLKEALLSLKELRALHAFLDSKLGKENCDKSAHPHRGP